MKHYRNCTTPEEIKTGHFRQRFSTGNLQYLDNDSWKDINLNLRDFGSNHWGLETAPYKALIPKKANGEIWFGNHQHEFSWKCDCNPIDGVLTDTNRVYYENAFSTSIHLEIAAGKNRFQKTIIIDEKPSPVPDYLEFQFELNTKFIEMIRCAGDSRYENFKDIIGKSFSRQIELYQDDEKVSYIRPAKVWDSTGREIDLPLRFYMRGGKLYMVKRIPRAILNNAVYPLYTDGSSSYYSGSGDGHTTCAQTTWDAAHDAVNATSTDYTNTLYIYTGLDWWDPNRNIHRAFFPFNTTGLPLNCVVSAATFSVYPYSGNGTRPTCRVCETFQVSNTALQNSDFEDCGYDSGYEQGGRAKETPIVAGSDSDVTLTDGAYRAFTLNSTGIGWIKRDGSTWTRLGVREKAHDCDDSDSGTSAYRSMIRPSEYTGTANDPILDVTYTKTYSVTGSGGITIGGSADLAVDIEVTGSGGITIGGQARVIRQVSYDTSNVIAFTANIKEHYSISCSNEATNFPASYASDYLRPNKKFHTQDTTETDVLVEWAGDIDTILLYNCNFGSFNIEVAAEESFSTFQDKDTGMWHGIVRIDKDAANYSHATNFAIIEIPVQSTLDSESYFSIGAIVGGMRQDFTKWPSHPLRRELIENIWKREFDGGAKEIETSGKPFHLLEYSWMVEATDFQELAEIENHIDVDGAVILHEKRTDYEAVFLAQKIGGLKYEENYGHNKATMQFRELV